MAVINNSINAPLPLKVAQGGTGLNSLTAHGILVGEGTSAINPIVLANGQLLLGSNGADPVAATLTSGGTIAFSAGAGSLSLDINTVDVAHGGTGKTSVTAHALLVGNGTSALNELSLTNGQLLIGSTGADPVPAQLTAGLGIAIQNSAGGITISTTGAQPYFDIVASPQTMTAGSGYITDSATLVTLNLPATAAVGDVYTITGKGTGGWKIAQNAGQTIYFGNTASTTGATGFLASTLQRDSLQIVCVTANNDFNVIYSVGNIDVE